MFDENKKLFYSDLINDKQIKDVDEYIFDGLNMDDIELYLRILFNEEEKINLSSIKYWWFLMAIKIINKFNKQAVG